MKICFVGALDNVHMRRWIDQFKQEHTVSVIHTGAHPAEIEGCDVRHLPLARDADPRRALLKVTAGIPRNLLRYRRLLRELRPDLVHVHYVNDAALLAALAWNGPLVMTAWGSDILVSPRSSAVRRSAVAWSLRRARLVTCDAAHMRTALEALGTPPERVEIVYFGTDVEKYHPRNRDVDRLRERLALPAGPTVVSFRNHEPIYDLSTFIRAIPSILARVPEALFLIGGSGSLTDALKDEVRTLGVERAVRFTGRIDQRDLPALLASTDVYVSTALSDAGIAASTAEAMASGVPVVVTDVADNGEWVAPEKTGLLVPPSAPAALADAVVGLLGDAQKRRSLGEAGRAVIVARNSLQREMARMGTFYARLVEGA